MHNRKCFTNHLGPWLIMIEYFHKAFAAIKANQWPLIVQSEDDSEESVYRKARRLALAGTITPEQAREYGLYSLSGDGVAVIEMSGPMMKGDSKYGGVNTVLARRLIRLAVQDDKVNSILLLIDSPGGSVAGTAELANEVKKADAVKPVFAHIEDLGASAAYWVASQARRITSNATGQIGSIGTVAVVDDSSKKYEMEGIKVHVISTGEFKGSFADGAPVPESHLEYLQSLVNELNSHFLDAVAEGRKLDKKSVKQIADGRVHLAKEAKSLGLIDGIQEMEDSISQMSEKYPSEKKRKTSRAEEADLLMKLSGYKIERVH